MKLFFNSSSTIIAAVCGILLFFLLGTLFRDASFLRLRSWRGRIGIAILLNSVSFAIAAIMFYNAYGFITDDINYYRLPSGFSQPAIWEISRPNQFMWFVVYPLKRYLGIDLPGFHVIFASLGVLSSICFLYVFSRTSDFRNRNTANLNRLAFWTLLCFPNFMAWGRFFGKDSTMFFLGSLFTVGSHGLLVGKNKPVLHSALLAGSLYIMQIIRPHIAIALFSAFLIALAGKLVLSRNVRDVGLGGLVRLYVPLSIVGLLIMAGMAFLVRMTGQEDVSLESTQSTLVSVSKMGGYGGSETDFGQKVDENPDIIFSPVQIGINVFNLFFAPMPWQIRGAFQVIAFVSNLFLFFLLFKYRKNLRVKTPWEWFLVLAVAFLTIILSFMTGNVGLIMRQKIIILPFLFLLLFHPSDELNADTQSRNNVSKRRNNSRHQTFSARPV